jgi:2-methylisocitrate lyase-like PEP mutase family enzyme
MSARLRARVTRPADELVLAPLALDALSAALARDVGFGAIYLGGGALGYARGVSEALLTATEVAEATRAITERVDVDVIVDGTTGFGDAVHVSRTVALLEQAGAAAIEIEDQLAPKRAHHQKGIDHMIPMEEMVGKIEVAVESRSSDLVLVARCNALSHDGLEDALARLAAYAQAGADVLMVFPRTQDELAAISAATTLPLAAFAPGELPAEDLRAAGFSLLCDPYSATLLTVRALRDGYETLRDGGSVVETPERAHAELRAVVDLIGMQELFAIEARTTERELYKNPPPGSARQSRSP